MMRTALFIALRHLTQRRRQTILTVLGIAIGVMVLISSFSMMDGLLVAFIKQMLQVSPHITVKPEKAEEERRLFLDEPAALVNLVMPGAPEEEEEIRNYRALEKALVRISGVAAVSPEVLSQGFLLYGANQESVQFHGVIPGKQKLIGNIVNLVEQGSWQEFEAETDSALVGYKLARALQVQVGDQVRAVGPSGEILSFRVAGLLNTGMNSFDRSHLFIHLEKAQQLEGMPAHWISHFNLAVSNPDQVETIARRIEKITGRKALTWQEENKNTLSMYAMMGRVSYVLVIFTMLVAGLGVSNVLTTIVLQKKRDIAALLSMGYRRSMVSLAFLAEGVILGVAGSLIGCALGYVNTRFMGSIPMEFSEAAVMAMPHLYMNQSPWYYLLSAGFGFLVSMAAGAAPARRAARLDPVEIIREEV